MVHGRALVRLAGSIVVGAVVAGCGGGGGSAAPAAGPAPAGSGPGPGGGSPTTAPSSPPVARAVHEGRFATSLVCAACHSTSATATALHDAAGRAIGPFDLWQASMMANAARDPFWRAEVSAEVAATPAARAAIEATCMRCHAPMASVNAVAAGEPLETSLLSQDTARGQLALDGVSCTLCHALAEPAAGAVAATFDGRFALGPAGQLFGPHAAPFAQPMINQSGFTPVLGAHVTRSAHCASCHTLTTDALDASGAPTGGRVHEQSPYLEWQASAYNDEGSTRGPLAASCQSCHVPVEDEDGAPILTAIARTPGGGDFPRLTARSPVGRHLYVGGNTLVPAILRDQAAELKPLAPVAAFDAVIAAARRQLRERTAEVRIASSARAGDQVEVAVEVRNRTGHKLPTGHPSRRAWLRLRVFDATGRVVFTSGEHDAQGRIVDAAGAPLPSELAGGPVPPHRDLVTSADEVAIYQAVLADGQGAPTFLLLRGEGFFVDDRLLPVGFDPAHPSAAEIAPVGTAGDRDFVAGGDTVRFVVTAPVAGGPYRVEATLLFQALGTRFVAELLTKRTPEVLAFERYLQAADRRPEQVTTASTIVP